MMALFGWFRDWRERRGALREVRAWELSAQWELNDKLNNPLQLAIDAVAREDLQAAAEHWEEARRTMPDIVLESEHSAQILMGLKRFDEADAFVLEAHRRGKGGRRWLTDLARIAEARGNFAEAVVRWRRVRKAGDPLGLVHEANCHMRLGDLDRAEHAFNQFLRMDSSSADSLIGRARVSEARGDWREAERRWRIAGERLEFPFVIAAHANALTELGRLEDADAVLRRAVTAAPGNVELAVARCKLAECRGDTDAACELWAGLQRIAPYFAQGYRDRTACLLAAGRHDEADAVMREAIERFPDDWWPSFEYAQLAGRREDWHVAVERWAAFRARFPDREEGYGWGAAALASAGRHDEAGALKRPIAG
jgi:tetratricopeptide (TPR) repeat protein